jgi:REP element-mobilizing transposase RayT
MANTYSQLFYHLVFSTKKRLKFIAPEIETRVWSYIGGVAREHDLTALQVGGIEDHIHSLVMAKPVIAPFQIPQWLKGDSSKWIHVEFPEMSKFSWQDGYGIFSVSKSQIPDVIKYIENQREHHATQTFEDEYLSLLQLRGVEYDERYVFD